MKKTNIFYAAITALILLALSGLVLGTPIAVTMTNTSVATTNVLPSYSFNYISSFNGTASCTLYLDTIVANTNATVINNTETFIAPTSSVGYYVYRNTYVRCTNETATNTSPSIVSTIAPKNCVGAESVFTWALTAMLMIGIAVFVVMIVVSGNPDPKLIIGVVIGGILLVVMLAIVNPMFASICV